MKKDRTKDIFLEQLRKIPVISVGCDKAGISRNSVYRWRKEDKKFKNDMEKAMANGEANMIDMSEAQLLSLVKDKYFPAIQLWLRHHHPKYSNKIEITAKIEETETLTPDQKKLMRKALKLALPQQTYEQEYPESHQDDSQPDIPIPENLESIRETLERARRARA